MRDSHQIAGTATAAPAKIHGDINPIPRTDVAASCAIACVATSDALVATAALVNIVFSLSPIIVLTSLRYLIFYGPSGFGAPSAVLLLALLRRPSAAYAPATKPMAASR